MESPDGVNQNSNNTDPVVVNIENGDNVSEEQTVLLSDTAPTVEEDAVTNEDEEVNTSEQNVNNVTSRFHLVINVVSLLIRVLYKIIANIKQIFTSIKIISKSQEEQQNTVEPSSVDNASILPHDVETNVSENEEQSTLLNIHDVSVNLPFIDEDVDVQEEQQNTVEPSVTLTEDVDNVGKELIKSHNVANYLLRELIIWFGVIYNNKSFLISGILGFADVVTDLVLVLQYALKGQYLYYGLTALFILLPSLMTTTTLYKMCKQEDRDSQLNKCLMKWKWSWLCVWPLLFICQMSSAGYALIHALSPEQLTEQQSKTKQKLLDLQLIDVFNEAAPQATLQYYILGETLRTDSDINIWWQLISIWFSVCTITRVVAAYLCYYRTVNRYYSINGFLILPKIQFISLAFVNSPIVIVCYTVIHIVLCYIGLGYLQWKSPHKPNLIHWFTFPVGSLFYVHVIDKSIFSYHVVSKLPLYKLFYALYYLEFIILIIICVFRLPR